MNSCCSVILCLSDIVCWPMEHQSTHRHIIIQRPTLQWHWTHGADRKRKVVLPYPCSSCTDRAVCWILSASSHIFKLQTVSCHLLVWVCSHHPHISTWLAAGAGANVCELHQSAAVGLTEAPPTAEPELSMATNEVEVAAPASTASKCAF